MARKYVKEDKEKENMNTPITVGISKAIEDAHIYFFNKYGVGNLEIQFINKNGMIDSTEFDATSYWDVVQCWTEFCSENGIDPFCVLSVELGISDEEIKKDDIVSECVYTLATTLFPDIEADYTKFSEAGFKHEIITTMKQIGRDNNLSMIYPCIEIVNDYLGNCYTFVGNDDGSVEDDADWLTKLRKLADELKMRPDDLYHKMNSAEVSLK